METNRKIAAILRNAGLTVVSGNPKHGDMSNVWLIGDKGNTHVINVQTFSVLGYGCFSHPKYKEVRDDLMKKTCDALTEAGVAFERSLTPDQLFINGYQPKSWGAIVGGR